MNQPIEGVEFVPDAEVERAVKTRTPARAFVRALQDHPGRWAKVPENISTPHLRQIKTYGTFFDVPIELKIVSSEERWARAMTRAGKRAVHRAGELG